MNTLDTRPAKSQRWIRPVAILAGAFGGMTLISGGSILFELAQAQSLAGDYMQFVVFFNFIAGFLYIAAAVGIWLGRDWAFGLASLIAAATAVTALVFGYQVMQGAAFEMRTIGALTLRFGLWAAIALALYRSRHPS